MLLPIPRQTETVSEKHVLLRYTGFRKKSIPFRKFTDFAPKTGMRYEAKEMRDETGDRVGRVGGITAVHGQQNRR